METLDMTLELSVVIPCLNESGTLAKAVSLASELIAASGLPGEVVISDNGSDDGSQRIAEEAGARVVLPTVAATASRCSPAFALPRAASS